MSDTETGTMPPPNELIINHDGLIRWRPEYESLWIDRLPGGGRRVTIGGFREGQMTFNLDAKQVEHLSGLRD